MMSGLEKKNLHATNSQCALLPPFLKSLVSRIGSKSPRRSECREWES